MALTWLKDLNEPQRRAVTHPGGPALVIAGAGSGKTRTLACRVAWLIERGVAPDRILLLTFTRRAAVEMLRRAGEIAGPAAARRVWGGTFHATANRLLRIYGRALGLQPEFTLMDQADAADMLNLIRGELGLDRLRHRFPQKNTLIAIYSQMVNSRLHLAEVLSRHYPWCQDAAEGIRRIFEEYTQRKRGQQILDYDDLLLYWKALCDAPAISEEVTDRFDQILVDEYQDTNLVQAEILQAMRRRRRDIMVVGDDAQSIYSFRAATIRNILDFPQQFPGAKIITLEQNYRSTQPILEAANAVMAFAKEQYTKRLFSHRQSAQRPRLITCQDEAEQSRAVCDRVLELHEEGTALHRQAVLFRAGHHSDQLEIELARRNIPFVKYGGIKFVEAAHVKDMIAFLRLMENPSEVLSWYRVLQLLEGIGPATARKVIEALLGARPVGEDDRNGGRSEGSPLYRLLHHPPTVPTAAREEFAAFRRVIADCAGVAVPGDGRPLRANGGTQRGELSPALQIERIRAFYEPIFRRTYDNPTVRLRDLDVLEQLASGYTTRRQFLTDLVLDPPASTQELAGPPLLDEDYLILSTIHSAKGCEWDAVHILHVADGMIPSDMATGSQEEIEEERRLLYVAMTRAKNVLNLYFPLRSYDRARPLSDRHSYGQLSRFLPDPILPLFESVVAYSAPPDDPLLETPAGTAQAIDAMLKELWRG